MLEEHAARSLPFVPSLEDPSLEFSAGDLVDSSVHRDLEDGFDRWDRQRFADRMLFGPCEEQARRAEQALRFHVEAVSFAGAVRDGELWHLGCEPAQSSSWWTPRAVGLRMSLLVCRCRKSIPCPVPSELRAVGVG